MEKGREEWGEAGDGHPESQVPLPFPVPKTPGHPPGQRRPLPWTVTRCPLSKATCPSQASPPSRGYLSRERRCGAQHGRKVKGSQGGVRCLPDELGRGGAGGETETGKPREGACWEDQRFERGGKDQPAGRAVRGAGGGPWEARAHLVTVRRARGLCALSRPRRAPMPASTSSAATPHTA